MRRHSIAVINQIKDLRTTGLSIPEIISITGVSKTTIWHHVHDIVLDSEFKKIIKSKQGGSAKRCELSWEKAKLNSIKLLSSKSRMRDLYYAVAMLYWAEGSKRELVFTNTDIDMVNLYIKFMIHGLDIDKKNIFLLIRISDPILPRDAISYWAKGTKTPLSNIKINHNNIQNKTKTKFGICRVSTRKGAYSLKVIHCIIDAVKRELLPL